MSVNESFRKRLKVKYGDDGDLLANLLQQCIYEGNTSDKDIKKCLKEKIKGTNLEAKVDDDAAEGIAIIMSNWVTVG